MVEWRLVYEHDFREGHAPNWGGWGDISLVDEGLQLSPGGAYAGVYFFPTTHKPEFMLETKVKMVKQDKEFLNVQILTRDGSEVNSESGLTLFYGENKGSVRHMVNKCDYLLQSFEVGFTVELERWYIMDFAFYEGTVEAYIDGVKKCHFDGGYPKNGTYTEPHVAVFNGTAIFQYVRVYEKYEPPPSPPSPLTCLSIMLPTYVVLKERLVPDLVKLLKASRDVFKC